MQESISVQTMGSKRRIFFGLFSSHAGKPFLGANIHLTWLSTRSWKAHSRSFGHYCQHHLSAAKPETKYAYRALEAPTCTFPFFITDVHRLASRVIESCIVYPRYVGPAFWYSSGSKRADSSIRPASPREGLTAPSTAAFEVSSMPPTPKPTVSRSFPFLWAPSQRFPWLALNTIFSLAP